MTKKYLRTAEDNKKFTVIPALQLISIYSLSDNLCMSQSDLLRDEVRG